MKLTRSIVILMFGALAATLDAAAAGAGFVDVLDAPAPMSSLAAKSLLQDVARAGDRLVAVGQRGHVIVSGDGGRTWKQGKVPVSSDLTSLYFVDGKDGWATGQDGVVLHSGDGGDSWELQLDGRKANDLLVTAMERNAAAEPSETTKALLAEARRYRDQGPDKPFLDVWFADAQNGYVVGAYNLLFRTTDGGKTWQPWFDRTDNRKYFNLYAIRPVGDDLYIAGEGGLILKLDPASKRFKALAIPYNGSFFGVGGAGSAVLVFGLRGNIWRSDDRGLTWAKVDAGLRAAVVGTTAADGAFVLADAGGRFAASTDGGHSFRPVRLKQSMPIAGFAVARDGRFVLAGPRGVAVSDIATP